MGLKAMSPLLAAILLVACDSVATGAPIGGAGVSQAPQQPVAEGRSGPPASMAELAEQAAVRCGNPATGEECEAGDYDVELLPNCGREGFFAGVGNADGATLVDKAPPEDSVHRAVLSQGQILCIQAIARAGQNPAWYYVTALPAASIEACNGNSLCERYGDRKVESLSPKATNTCRSAGAGRFAGECATGWVRASELDVFSEGM